MIYLMEYLSVNAVAVVVVVVVYIRLEVNKGDTNDGVFV